MCRPAVSGHLWPTRGSSAGIVVLCGVIYVVGGYDGNCHMYLSGVEVYNPDEDQWVGVSKTGGVGVGVVRGLLYSIGGHDDFPLVQKSRRML